MSMKPLHVYLTVDAPRTDHMSPGYRQLAFAVIYRAIQDLKADPHHPGRRMTAELFLEQNGPRSLLAFWCAVAGLDMDRVRSVLYKRKRQPWAC